MTDAGNPTDTIAGIESLGSLRIDCYIRSNISRVSDRQVEAILERLRSLSEAGLVADYQTRQWPPKRHAVVESQAAETTRGELLAKFEGWADQRGYSLKPAFQRRMVPGSLVGADEPREEVRVPIVTLALYDESTETEPLTGVVPYTDEGDADERRTYTIDAWLSALEDRPRQSTGPVTQPSPAADGD